MGLAVKRLKNTTSDMKQQTFWDDTGA